MPFENQLGWTNAQIVEQLSKGQIAAFKKRLRMLLMCDAQLELPIGKAALAMLDALDSE